MVKQELCLSNYEDIIDAVTMEGAFPDGHHYAYANAHRCIKTAPVDVVTMLDNDLHQRPVVEYFCWSAPNPVSYQFIC